MNDVEHLIEQLADDGPVRGAGSVFDGATQRATRHRKVRTRRRIVSGAAAVVALGVVVALVAQSSPSKPDHNGVHVAGEPTTTVGSTPAIAGATAAQLAAGHWSVVPAAPISPRSGATVVWTGKEIIVCGCVGGAHAQLSNDGAAYDRSTRTWRLLPAAPIMVGSTQTAVWTGSEMVIVGRAAAAYRPASNSWRSLPAVPIPTTDVMISVWTGDRVVVFAGSDVAAYDPASDTWQRLPSIPAHEMSAQWDVSRLGVQVAVAGSHGQLFAWAGWEATMNVTANETRGNGGSDLLRFDATANRWVGMKSGTGAILMPEEAFWVGGRVLVRGDMHIPGALGPGPLPETSAWYDADTGRATRLPADALNAGQLSSSWTGSALWSLNAQELAGEIRPGDASVYDPVANTWQRIASAPFGCGSPSAPVWTGTSVFVYCPLTYQSHLHGAGPVGGLEYDVG